LVLDQRADALFQKNGFALGPPMSSRLERLELRAAARIGVEQLRSALAERGSRRSWN